MDSEPLLSIALEFREGSSDKVYRACIEKRNSGFVVNFAYGRRGSALNTGTKTTRPVTYGEAVKIYDQLVRSKTAKGYRPISTASAGIGMIVAKREERDSGLRPQLLNPITAEECEQYLNDDDWCAQEKFDGKRMMIRRTGSEIIATNRNGLCVGFPESLEAQLAGLSRAGNFVIDGEIIGDTLFAFDLLETHEGDIRSLPYRIRLAKLTEQFGGASCTVVAQTVTGVGKREFMKTLQARNKEGIVFKDLRSGWSAGRPASGGTALKLKFWASCSCVVSRLNSQRSIEVSLSGAPVGNVTIPPSHDIPSIGKVVEIRYLYVTGIGGSLYQPVYLGERDDISAQECTMEQLKYKAA